LAKSSFQVEFCGLIFALGSALELDLHPAGLEPATLCSKVQGPLQGEWWSGMAIAHAITWSVHDSAALLDATAGPEIGDPHQVSKGHRSGGRENLVI
jgi:hypothetical protein